MKIYATVDGGRFFALPDAVELPAGHAVVRRLLGPPERADLVALAPYEVPPAEARALAREVLDDSPLGQLEGGLLALQEQLRSPEARAALQQVAVRLKQMATDATVRRALRKLDRKPAER